jgi:hypothetical protein
MMGVVVYVCRLRFKVFFSSRRKVILYDAT